MTISEQVIAENRHIGFDVLAEMLGIPKKDVKKIHNNLGLGLKRFPNTKFSDYFTPKKDKKGFIVREGGRPVYVCTKDWIWFEESGKLGVFRKGDETDLLSVPKFAWWFLDTSDEHAVLASLPHDQGCAQMYPLRPIVDFKFYKDLRYLKTSWFKSLVAYVAVSLGSLRYIVKDREKGRVIRLKNEINFWKYVKENNMADEMIKLYKKQQ